MSVGSHFSGVSSFAIFALRFTNHDVAAIDDITPKAIALKGINFLSNPVRFPYNSDGISTVSEIINESFVELRLLSSFIAEFTKTPSFV